MTITRIRTSTTKLKEIAAEIITGIGGADYINGLPPSPRRILKAGICRQLSEETGCALTTAQRHIKASLGLAPPISERRVANLPVQSITARATREEWLAIRPKARAHINALLAEKRVKKDDRI